MVYIGAGAIVSPLGTSARENYDTLCAGGTGIALHPRAGWKSSDVHLAAISSLPQKNRFYSLLKTGLSAVLAESDPNLLSSPDTLVMVSSTKGDVAGAIENPFHSVFSDLVTDFALRRTPLLVSNACISGVLSINLAASLLSTGACRHVVVLGCDTLSDFVLFGFQSLFALSDVPCRPFDADRRGVTLGEGCGGVVLSLDKDVFRHEPVQYLGGADANDANHISGPSRTGEGLVRAVSKAVDKAEIGLADIAFINAHGTGTSFNDEMESIAFGRLGIADVPLNSLKGYWGHTLGAAGVMETVACIESVRHGRVCASAGYQTPGTSVALNVLTENAALPHGVVLKTASGFGGGNAALLVRKI